MNNRAILIADIKIESKKYKKTLIFMNIERIYNKVTKEKNLHKKYGNI